MADRLKKPVFELGLKAYLYGAQAVALARAAERIGREAGVTLIVTPQLVDIHAVAQATRDLLIFAPHLDPLPPGRGSGSVLAEAVKEAGAHGVLLNHAEKPVSLVHATEAIRRAGEVGLLSMVCAGSPEEVATFARLGPDLILAEPPNLIGGSVSVAQQQGDFIAQSMAAARAIDPEIVILNSAGIRTPADAAAVIRAGADGTGSTSGVLTANDPMATLEAMVRAVRQAWEERLQPAPGNPGA